MHIWLAQWETPDDSKKSEEMKMEWTWNLAFLSHMESTSYLGSGGEDETIVETELVVQ